ncbi:uncharacterized protein B0I36DRAFT_324899 [Microdochium trichocladiopsis]|uniref:Uncharacterized protein n=1 Tax=Microdochium trichocladiopsis TaxID=1682393 RepID=A0A9P9BPA1_9PEZI|nr:uncharacterized protein B0I36DRAFT_324899 [Microdochium trichocladiopsis]KAH7029037.1 hypothetical protein B0I36DRAFT_324899 [Microdochium trichocladiopsis]
MVSIAVTTLMLLPLNVVSALLSIPNFYGTEPSPRIFAGMMFGVVMLLLAVYISVHNWTSLKSTSLNLASAIQVQLLRRGVSRNGTWNQDCDLEQVPVT